MYLDLTVPPAAYRTWSWNRFVRLSLWFVPFWYVVAAMTSIIWSLLA